MTSSTDTEGGAMTLEKGLAAFLDAMLGKNRSTGTLRAYKTDILQFLAFLHENNVAITTVADVGKVDVLEYLAALARKGLTGVARARKVSAIREYFRFLEGVGVIHKSPTAGIDTPKREKHTRQYLRSDEYTKMLSLAGGNPRDYAILQVFLQTGIQLSELASLTLADADFIKPAIRAAIPGGVCNPVFIEIASLSFRKHLCHNALSSQPSAHFTSKSGECNSPECSQSA